MNLSQIAAQVKESSMEIKCRRANWPAPRSQSNSRVGEKPALLRIAPIGPIKVMFDWKTSAWSEVKSHPNVLCVENLAATDWEIVS